MSGSEKTYKVSEGIYFHILPHPQIAKFRFSLRPKLPIMKNNSSSFFLQLSLTYSTKDIFKSYLLVFSLVNGLIVVPLIDNI